MPFPNYLWRDFQIILWYGYTFAFTCKWTNFDTNGWASGLIWKRSKRSSIFVFFPYSFPPVVSRGSFRPWRASKPKSTLIRVRGWIGGKISSQPHTIVKQICFPNGNVLFLSLFSLSKNWMHNVVWGCAEILPNRETKEDTTCLVDPSICLSSHH